MSANNPRASGQSIVLIGLMGAGKTSVGRKLAKSLELSFVDADEEIVKTAGCSIEDIFKVYGEQAFREVEARVIARLLNQGPQVLATGGGAYLDAFTRDVIAEKGIVVWLRAELDVEHVRLAEPVRWATASRTVSASASTAGGRSPLAPLAPAVRRA